MSTRCVLTLLACAAMVAGWGRTAAAQTPEPSRRSLIEQAQAEKVKNLHPYPITKGERVMNKVEDITVNGGLHWHPYFESAYKGGGLAPGLGYMHHVSPYNLVDVRGSAPKSSSWPRGCSRAARRSRCSAVSARRPRSGSSASEPPR